MGSELTSKVVEQAAEQLKQMFINKARLMRKAWEQIDGDLVVSCNVKFKPAIDEHALQTDIGIGFKLDECKVKESFTFADGFGPLFDRGNMSGLTLIRFRDFGDLRKRLEEQAEQLRIDAARNQTAATSQEKATTDDQQQTDEDQPAAAPCIDCEFHKGMINKQKGVRIAGVPGKCVRDGGHCQRGIEWLKSAKGSTTTAAPKKKPEPKPKPASGSVIGKSVDHRSDKEKARSGMNYDV